LRWRLKWGIWGRKNIQIIGILHARASTEGCAFPIHSFSNICLAFMVNHSLSHEIASRATL
jgi:hypothetical protein